MRRVAVRPLLLFLLTWFGLATCVRANETQTENANPGTTAWQLTLDAQKREIEGYASLTSVNIGGSISFFVSTSDSRYTMDFYRIGWYGGAGGREAAGADHPARVAFSPPPLPTLMARSNAIGPLPMCSPCLPIGSAESIWSS